MGSEGKTNTEGKVVTGPRCIAIVGPFSSGKTSLLEAILLRCGATDRLGTIAAGNTYGDSSPEARAHVMSVEPNVVTTKYLDSEFTFVDCPGSVEFLQDMRAVLPTCDAAIVVCEADERKLLSLEVILREIKSTDIPHMLFINKIDTATASVQETLKTLQKASQSPLLLRQIPIWQDGVATGFIDLALERAFVYRESVGSELIETPAEDLERHAHARFEMLEKLADYDDELMEQLLEEVQPDREVIFKDLVKEFRNRQVVPAFIGSAQGGFGITRLLKALRHEAPTLADTQKRLKIPTSGAPLAQAIRTSHSSQGGKLTVARVLRGSFKDSDTVIGPHGNESRIAGLNTFTAKGLSRISEATEGVTVAFSKLDAIATGETFTSDKTPPENIISLTTPQPVYAFALKVKDRKDDVRLSTGLSKLIEEDPSLIVENNPELAEIRLMGQGEMHLRVALERLEARYQVSVDTKKPKVGYRETIRQAATARGRHKKQSGGHGQFGDIVIDVKPLPRGQGIQFKDTITGGVVPKQYIPSVETGVNDYVKKGPLGFPVVDIEVTLTDGSYHTVDSSDAAFQMAAKIGMAEAMPAAKPVLLEPILSVELSVPSDATSKATALVSERRGQILGFDAKPDWEGWDVVNALIPEAEIGDLIVKLRSATFGAGSFKTSFHSREEVSGKTADTVIAEAQN